MPVSIEKRNREKQRQERQKDTELRRERRRAEKGNRPPAEPGVDPDIAGIVPGPQPIDPTLT